MIRLMIGVSDLQRLRFAYSPMAEVAESLYVLNSGRVPSVHGRWFDTVRRRLRRVDMAALRAIVPAPRPHVASFLLAGAHGPSTSFDAQLDLVAARSVAELRDDLEVVWRHELPPETIRLLEHGGGPRIADALRQYWRVAIEPYWPKIRGVLDADIAYRTARLAKGGIEALLKDLSGDLELAEHAIHIQSSAPPSSHRLAGKGLVLVPCVFAWPHTMVDLGTDGAPSITYGPRAVATVWPDAVSPTLDEDALGALLGRSRAAILLHIGVARSTSDIARDLRQSMPAVSEHLAVLRRNGFVMSWRTGRRVLHQRTALATSVIAASAGSVAEHSSA